MSEPGHGPPARQLQLACLCAAWCRVCDDYASTIKTVVAEFDGIGLRWIDIEDDAALIGELDVETFPTLLLHARGAVLFGGVVEPQPQRLRQLLLAAAHGELMQPLVESGFVALAQRLADGS
jgi:thioredoxin-like negative regulator of GroEL